MSGSRVSIVAPSAPRWARPFIDADRFTAANVGLAFVLILVFVLSVTLVAIGPLAARIAGGVLGAALVTSLIAGARSATRNSVTQGDWRYRGQPVVGEARRYLASAAVRAADAERYVGEIPTKLDWAQFRPHVDALLWEAAGHAAEVCQLNEQLNRLTYAEPGSPQGVVQAELWQRRQEHLDVVKAADEEMLALARAAGNAAAAARVALDGQASVKDLAAVSPNAATLIAQGGIDEARTQLEILSDAWTEVDSGTALLAAALDEDVRSSKKRAPRGRRSPRPTDQQQEG